MQGVIYNTSEVFFKEDTFLDILLLDIRMPRQHPRLERKPA